MSPIKKPRYSSREEVIMLMVVLFIIGSIGGATIRYAVDRIIDLGGISETGQSVASNVQFMLGASWIFVGILVWMLTHELLKNRRSLMRDRTTLQTFLNSAGDGIFAINREFRITLWNKHAEEITGHRSIDVIGKPLRDIMVFHRERDRAEDMVFVEEAMLYGRNTTMPESMYISRKDGKEIPVGDSAAPLIEASGTIAGCIVVFRDATAERKQNSLRSEFAYASHQLKTPVTKALWSLEAAMDKPAPEKKDLEIAIGALQSIRKLSKEIVEVAEIEQNIVSVKLESVVIKETLEQALEELEQCVAEHESNVDISGVPADLMAQGDPRLVRRVFAELICNAVTYSRPGASVTVVGRQEPGKVIIEISDEGLGIPDKEQALVFTKFFRGSNLDTTTMPGAGLGSYIAKRYVESLRGHLWFTSVEGSGSTFSVSLRPVQTDSGRGVAEEA